MCHGLRQAAYDPAQYEAEREASRRWPEVAGGCLFCPMCRFLFGGTSECGRGTNLWLIIRPRWGLTACNRAYPRTYPLAASRNRIACEAAHCNVRNSNEIHYAAALVFRRNTSP
ncbi:hypothetical protein ALC56_02140 [Trachymyrmex septentrionalis]|uniref:Uncharacterized protein n=1 Tax=Trachymyrmex septentrionalis TaxID=34720 RepID=A0A195FU51_9HYME|nr:hypothetical protein ALC56_02140 [Trachymyrmex septentrionalis]